MSWMLLVACLSEPRVAVNLTVSGFLQHADMACPSSGVRPRSGVSPTSAHCCRIWVNRSMRLSTRFVFRNCQARHTDWYTFDVATTIKVPEDLRDRINRGAQERGVTAAGLIEGLLDGYERRRRMEAFGRAFRGADEEYWDEFREWDVALNDGHDGE